MRRHEQAESDSSARPAGASDPRSGLRSTTFQSILHPRPGAEIADAGEVEPEYFRDLNLDQMVDAIVANRAPYDLKPFLHLRLHDVETVAYRQEALQDLEDDRLRKAVDDFAEGMVLMRRHHDYALKLRNRCHRNRWLRESVKVYCETVTSLGDDFSRIEVGSRSFQGLRDHLAGYMASGYFTALVAEGQSLDQEIDAIRYTVQIRGDRVTVRRYEGGDDYSLDVERTFAKFKQSEVKDRRAEYSAFSDQNHIEAHVLDLVGELFPKLFARLDDYCSRNRDFVDEQLARFDREVQFYLAYLDYIAPLREAGLMFCYPQVSTRSKETHVTGAFDLSLATKLVHQQGEVVRNDFHLSGGERALVVTGPNQGGKTTFARMFGQLHHLGALGYPIPGEAAELFLPDRIFTHFEREEQLETLRGKLEDELVRVHAILSEATPDSIVIMNESFSSTTLNDTLLLGTEMLQRMVDLGLLCVYVTFVDELASLSEATVSMVAMIDPDDPARRTFRIIRRPADGLAYAAAIARKYGLGYAQLKGRVES